MKKMYKKISAIALVGMMAVGGIASSVIRVEAVGGGPSIGNIHNADDQQFVEKLCRSMGIKILKSSINPNEIDSYVKREFKGHKAEKRLLDMSPGGIFKSGEQEYFKEYLEDLLNLLKQGGSSAKIVYRVSFGIREYIIKIK